MSSWVLLKDLLHIYKTTTISLISLLSSILGIKLIILLLDFWNLGCKRITKHIPKLVEPQLIWNTYDPTCKLFNLLLFCPMNKKINSFFNWFFHRVHIYKRSYGEDGFFRFAIFRTFRALLALRKFAFITNVIVRNL